jgi:hypothetical protein
MPLFQWPNERLILLPLAQGYFLTCCPWALLWFGRRSKMNPTWSHFWDQKLDLSMLKPGSRASHWTLSLKLALKCQMLPVWCNYKLLWEIGKLTLRPAQKIVGLKSLSDHSQWCGKVFGSKSPVWASSECHGEHYNPAWTLRSAPSISCCSILLTLAISSELHEPRKCAIIPGERVLIQTELWDHWCLVQCPFGITIFFQAHISQENMP